MKKHLTALCLALAFSLQPSVFAADLFRSGEVTLDLAATASDTKAKFNDAFDRSFSGADLGVSLGGAYWAHRNFGVGFDLTIPDADSTSEALFDDLNVSFLARVPIGHLSPYALAGGGRNIEHGEYTAHAGAGVEWRFNELLGTFAEYRYVWSQGSGEDTAQIRTGIRLAF